MRDLPEGTVTFVFTDIEGSTRLAAEQPDDFRRALRDHNEILRGELARHGGYEVRTEGDSLFAVFPLAPDAVRFAAAAQRALGEHEWPGACEIRVRMGLHTGTGVRADHENDDYVGIHVHRAARIESAGHGGQVLVSEATRALAAPDLDDLSFRDMGLHRLKDLDENEHLYQLIGAGLEDVFPALRTLSGVPNNLPAHLTSFIGRERTLREAVKKLEEGRLVTLTGPGGTGKTRLSIRMGGEVLASFPDGVFFVDLASVEDEALVPAEVLRAMGMRPSRAVPPEDLLLHFVADKEILFILDNLEQIPGTADLVAEVLRTAPDVKVVATSRAALHLRGEQEFPVPPLSLPEDEDPGRIEALHTSEAVALFVDRARDVSPGFALDDENASDIAELVRRLDGLPLAIELAAARTRAFPVEVILERLSRGMLAGGSRDLPARQRTISAAIEWSYDILSGPCRRLFERFSVFSGGAGIDEIEAVCGPASELGGEVLDALTELVDQSLVVPPSRSRRNHYEMLITIRDYARECLAGRGEVELMRDRHLEVYSRLAREAEPHLIREDQAEWLDRLSEDRENLRAALSWAIDRNRADTALRMVGALWRFWQIRGYLVEASERIAEALALDGGEPGARLCALEAAGGIAYWQGDAEQERFYREAVEIARDQGDPRDLADALYNWSFAVALSDHDEGLRVLEEARSIYARLGDEVGLARVRWAIGNAKTYRDEYESSLDDFQAAADGLEGADRPFDHGWALFALGFAHLQAGNTEAAEGYLRRSFEIFRRVKDISGEVLHLAAFAATAYQRGDRTRAYRLSGAMSALRDKTGFGLVDTPENVYRGLTPEDLARLEGEDAEAFAAGRAMSAEAATAYALGEIDV